MNQTLPYCLTTMEYKRTLLAGELDSKYASARWWRKAFYFWLLVTGAAPLAAFVVRPLSAAFPSLSFLVLSDETAIHVAFILFALCLSHFFITNYKREQVRKCQKRFDEATIRWDIIKKGQA